MNWLTKTLKQDRHLDDFKGHSRASIEDVGAAQAISEHTARFQTVCYATGKYEPKSVRNVAKTNRIMRLMEEREKVYEDNSKILGMLKMDEYNESKKSRRAQFKAK